MQLQISLKQIQIAFFFKISTKVYFLMAVLFTKSKKIVFIVINEYRKIISDNYGIITNRLIANCLVAVYCCQMLKNLKKILNVKTLLYFCRQIKI